MSALAATRSGLPRPVDARAVAGVLAAAVAVVLGAAGCVLLAGNVAAGAAAESGPAYWPQLVVGTLAYGLVGAWLVTRRTAGALGPLFLAVALCEAASMACRSYGVRGLQVADGLPGDRWAFWVSTWVWVPALLSLILVVPLFVPGGVLLSRRWRPAVACAALTIVVAAAVEAVTPYDRLDEPILDPSLGPNPAAFPGAADVAATLRTPLFVLGGVLAVAALVVRWRTTDAGRRRALAWVLYGIALTVVLGAVALVLSVPGLAAAAVAALPACCAVAVARHRLWDLDLVVRRSLVYGGLTAVIAAAYAATVGLLGGAVGAGTGAPIVATALVAMLVLPLHHVLRRLVNRIVHGRSEDPYVTTTRLGLRLGSAVTPERVTTVVLPEILAEVARALSLRHLSLVTADGRTFAHGVEVPGAVELPLSHAGEPVGVLRAAPARGGLTRSERRALADVASQAAVAVHGVLLAAELQRERERVVVAREEERRRLRRELHDGVGTALAAACLQAETARDLMADRPGDGLALLTRLGEQLRDTVTDVRAVTRDLRPAMLDELGLAGSLAELGARHSTPERQVDVVVGELGEVPAAVEVAAYLVVAELVTNAGRHSGASRVRVEVRRDTGLGVRVADDGRGIAPGTADGVGLASVRRRVEELGGALVIRDRPGTVVDVHLPLDRG